MDKYKTVRDLHEAKRTRTHIVTLYDVLLRSFQLGWLKAHEDQRNAEAALAAEVERLTQLLHRWHVAGDGLHDEGTLGEGWQYNELTALVAETEAALAQQKQEG